MLFQAGLGQESRQVVTVDYFVRGVDCKVNIAVLKVEVFDVVRSFLPVSWPRFSFKRFRSGQTFKQVPVRCSRFLHHNTWKTKHVSLNS